MNRNSIKALGIGICIALLAPYTVMAEELGRLFTTPEERDMLNSLRIMAKQPAPEPEIEPEPVIEEVIPEPEPEPVEVVEIPGITVNGVVYRKGGKSTAWLNGENTLEGDLESQYLHVDGEKIKGQKVPVNIPNQQRSIELKPGQTWQPGTGEVIDIYKQPQPVTAPDEG